MTAPLRLALLVAVLSIAGCAPLAPAGGDRNLVSLQAQVSREVPNDQAVALLAVEARGQDPAALSAEVNRRMDEALRAAREIASVQARTGNYQTFPRHGRNERIESWQVAQELRLESGDFTALAQLVGRLQQAGLLVRSMTVRLSPEARRAAENALIGEAIAAFRSRAERVREAMRSARYDIQTLSLDSGEAAPPRPMMAMRAEAAPVAMEPGVSQVSLTASGTIRLE